MGHTRTNTRVWSLNNMKEKAGFQVKYEVRNTSLGKGVFVLEPVKQGTLIWRYKKGENVLCLKGKEETLAHLENLPSYEDRRYFVQHSYHDRGLLNHILDDGKLVNHSNTPNAGPGAEPLSTYAVRDIEKGEELREDYGLCEYPAWFLSLCQEYEIDFNYVK